MPQHDQQEAYGEELSCGVGWLVGWILSLVESSSKIYISRHLYLFIVEINVRTFKSTRSTLLGKISKVSTVKP